MKKTVHTLLLFLLTLAAQAQLTLVKDLYTGASSGSPMWYTAMNGKMYFSASSYDSAINLPGHHEIELWTTDGTAAGTYRVYDLPGGLGSSTQPYSLVVVNNNLFYVGSYSGGSQLWTSDGTGAGTHTVTTSGYPDAFPSASGLVMPFGNKVLVVANETSNFIRGLYQSDGTSAGTSKLSAARVSGAPVTFIEMNGTMYLMMGITHEYALSKTDGTAAGTKEVVAFKSYAMSNPAVLNNTLYFIGDTAGYNSELWKSDGTKAGTVRIKDIYPGNQPCNTFLTPMVTSGSYIYFWADDGTNGMELWRSDGTAAGTLMIKDLTAGSTGSNYSGNLLMPLNNRVLFAFQDANSIYSLWSTDGTTAGTFKLIDSTMGPSQYVKNFTRVGNRIVFTENNHIYSTDGTVAGTQLLTTVDLGALQFFTDIGYLNGNLYVTMNDSATGSELYKLPYSGPSGIEEAGSQQAFTVYPNPSGGVVHIKTLSGKELAEFNLYDQTGRLVVHMAHPQAGQPIAVDHLAPGFYFYNILSKDKQAQAGKLIISTR